MEEYYSFEEVGKEATMKADKSEPSFKAPIEGSYPSLYDELIDKCNPARFMRPYDPQKVDIANDIYSKLLKNKGNIDVLYSLRLQAIEDLGVKLSTEDLYYELLSVCNPENFVNESYSKSRLEQANKMYQAVLRNADDKIALENIKKQCLILYAIKEQKEDEQRKKREEEIKKEKEEDLEVVKVMLICLLVLVIVFIIAYQVVNLYKN